jgi:nicotinamidase-related amidase
MFQGLKTANALVKGSWGAEFHSSVQPQDGDFVIHKQAVSSFAGTGLGAYLRKNHVDTLVLSGVATNFVIEGTARQAADEGFRVVLLKDCCATFSQQMHDMAVDVLSHLVEVATLDDFRRALSLKWG